MRDTFFKKYFFWLFDECHEGECFRRFHGVWRVNYVRKSASTTFIGLNLIMYLGYEFLMAITKPPTIYRG